MKRKRDFGCPTLFKHSVVRNPVHPGFDSEKVVCREWTNASVIRELKVTFRSEYEDDYEYEF